MKRFLVAILLLSVILGLVACGQKDKDILREEDIRAVCELATLKCYYNNVAQIDKEADNIFQKDRKMWIEYEGEVVIGIDMTKVIIKISGDTVNITMPDAEIQSIKPLAKTLTEESYISSTDGWLIKNKITTEDQETAINKGQEEMEKAVLDNKSLFQKAEDRAKEFVENFIINLGKTIGKEYKIIWS